MRETGKFRSVRGFTLVEMLIVVAIIAILVAVSIPLVNTSLEKARDATDQANERAAKAEAVMVYLEMDDDLKETNIFKAYLYYDAASGKLVQQADASSITPYGKCTQEHVDEHLFMSKLNPSPDYEGKNENEGEHEGQIIMVMIDEGGEIQLFWMPPPKATI